MEKVEELDVRTEWLLGSVGVEIKNAAERTAERNAFRVHIRKLVEDARREAELAHLDPLGH